MKIRDYPRVDNLSTILFPSPILFSSLNLVVLSIQYLNVAWLLCLLVGRLGDLEKLERIENGEGT